jgi:hypothetical protein
MPEVKRIHVAPNPGGGWDLEVEGLPERRQHFSGKTGAIRQGRETARNEAWQLVIHGRDGQIQEERTYRKDAYPSPQPVAVQ